MSVTTPLYLMQPKDEHCLLEHLKAMLAIPSPCGMTEVLARYVSQELAQLGLTVQQTRRGALKACWRANGATKQPIGPTGQNDPKGNALGFVAHLDTLGAMIQGFRANGRPTLAMIGTWSARFAEGARVSVHLENGQRIRGTILPLQASGHRFNTGVDKQSTSWDNLELRLDADTHSPEETRALGIQVGDMVSVDTQPEFLDNGYIVSRHLDNKAAVAALLTALHKAKSDKLEPQRNLHFYFSVSEEIGTGTGHLVDETVSDLVALDLAVVAPDQSAHEKGVTIAMMDSSGPYDRGLSQQLVDTCRHWQIPWQRDVFRYYYSDTHSATLSGADCRMALACYACDSSHGWERTHVSSLLALAGMIRGMGFAISE